MTSMADDPAYLVAFDGDHLRGREYDATLVRFPGWEYTFGLAYPEPLKVPSVVKLRASETIGDTDFPITDVGWPIFPDHLLDGPLSLQWIPHRRIPLDILSADGEPMREIPRFSAIQLLTLHNVFDEVRSEYELETDPDLDEKVRFASKVEFLVPPDGLPPLFRLTVKPGVLFISSEAKEAAERIGVRGIRFLSPRSVGMP